MIKRSEFRCLVFAAGLLLAQAGAASVCGCEGIGQLNDDGSVTLQVKSSFGVVSPWVITLVKKPGEIIVNLRDVQNSKNQRLRVKQNTDFIHTELTPFDLPTQRWVSPGVALRLVDGGTAGPEALLITYNPMVKKFVWVKNSGKILRIYNPSLSEHGGILVGGTIGSGYHDVSCFKATAAGRVTLLGTAFWEYPGVWKISGYRAGHPRHLRLSGLDQPTNGVCTWALDMLAK